MKIHLIRRKLIIEVIDLNLELIIKILEQPLKKMKIKPFKKETSPNETSEIKWFSEFYTRQKLGNHRCSSFQQSNPNRYD